jgi:hypothetical protein
MFIMLDKGAGRRHGSPAVPRQWLVGSTTFFKRTTIEFDVGIRL